MNTTPPPDNPLATVAAQAPIRVAYLVSHPIQYQAPLLRKLAALPEIDLRVFFLDDFGARLRYDRGFNRHISWDVDLLSGYESQVLPGYARASPPRHVRPLTYALRQHLHDFRPDLLWVHGHAHHANFRAINIARRSRIPVIYRAETHHNLPSRKGLSHHLGQRVTASLFRHINAFMAIGTLNRAYYRERGIDPDRIFWMPYVVDNAFFSARAAQSALTRERFRASLGLDPTRPVVLFASKLHRRKRPLDLLEAFVRLSSHGYAQPWPYLLFVGDGEEAPSLRARIQALGWDSVRLLGFRNQSELPSFYDLCDVFVLPSEAEPWGLVVNEVMNAAKPVIVTDQVGCAPDLVTNGDNGYVVPPRDPAALADKIARLTTNPARQSHMGRGSLQRIREWDLDIAVAGFRAAIRSLHSRRTVP